MPLPPQGLWHATEPLRAHMVGPRWAPGGGGRARQWQQQARPHGEAL